MKRKLENKLQEERCMNFKHIHKLFIIHKVSRLHRYLNVSRSHRWTVHTIKKISWLQKMILKNLQVYSCFHCFCTRQAFRVKLSIYLDCFSAFSAYECDVCHDCFSFLNFFLMVLWWYFWWFPYIEINSNTDW